MPDDKTKNEIDSLEIDVDTVYDTTSSPDTGKSTSTADTSDTSDTTIVDLSTDNIEDEDKGQSHDDDSSQENDNEEGKSIKSFEDLATLLSTKKTEDLTETEQEELSSIMDAFGGSAFNDKGELLDANNKVIFTAEQVKFFMENGTLPLDEEGNFVNASGDIVKNKVELFRETTTVGVIMNSLAKNFNVSFKDTFMPDDTEESIVDIVNKVVGVVNSNAVASYFKNNPELESFRKHLELYGSAKDYKGTTTNYDKIIVKDLSSEAKKAYIMEAGKVIGKPVSDNYLKYLETLSEEDYNVEVAQHLTILKNNQVAQQQEVEAKLQEKKDKELQDAREYWGKVENIVKNGKISNINIPLPEREPFLQYLTAPVQNGKSKDMLDTEKDDVEFDLSISYLRFKNKDITALVKNLATTQQVASLRSKLNQNKNRNTNSDKGYKPKTQDDYIPGFNDVLL